MNIDVKLSQIESKIKDESFRQNRGLSNEVGYYIFDYDPQFELKVRDEVSRLVNKYNADSSHSFSVVEFDLYEIIIEIIEDEEVSLDEIFSYEQEDGIKETIDAIISLLQLNSENNLIVNYIVNRTPDDCVVFLTGVGKSYPILRSHNVLNNLHQKLDKVPVVLFFPGKYSGTDFKLFNTIESTNYYRAFPLIS